MNNMVKIFLVRHGETMWNKSLRYQGHKDIPLSEIGQEQALKLGQRLKNEKIDAVYASDLSRAFDTAAAIAQHHNLDVIKLKDLRETNFGCWEGLTYNQIVDVYEEIMNNWKENPLATTIPEGECLQDVVDRTHRAYQQVIDRHQGQTIVLAAHGGTNRIILAGLLGMNITEYWKMRQDNVCLNIIEVYDKERAIVCLLNDTCHLY